MQKDLENVTCKEVSAESFCREKGSSILEGEVHSGAFPALWSTDPNRAGDEYDVQPARVQGLH